MDDRAGVVYPDWARRMADILNLHVACGNHGRVAAIRLADGGSDGQLYDTRADAIRHQLHETLCDYIVVKPTSYSARDCYDRLSMTRALYDSGWRWGLDTPAVILPSRIEALRQSRLLLPR